MQAIKSFGRLVPVLLGLAWSGGALAAAPLGIGPYRLDAAQVEALDAATRRMPGASSLSDDPERLQEFGERYVLARQAQQAHLDADPVVAARVALAVDGVLADAERERLFRSAPVSEADIAHRFAERPGDFDEYELSHIFVALAPQGDARRGHPLDDAQALARAQALKHRLDAGDDFVQLARKESDDGASAEDGGRVSAVFGQYLDDAFAPAVRTLVPGQVSAPVRGPNGYHLIRLEARQVATLDRARPLIEAQLREEARDRALAALRQAYPVVASPVSPDTTRPGTPAPR
jgi:parvulin-like peptidyl-prolyl isomerase